MKSPNKQLIVTAKNQGTRLDIFLSEKLKITRSQVQKLITRGAILLNNQPPKKAGARVSAGDTIAITKSSNLLILTSSGEPKTKKLKDYKISEPKIIAQTKDYVVIAKPIGLVVHPTLAKENNTLVAWLVKKFPKIKTVGDDPKIRPGIVHRLDKDASGLMVVALNQPMFENLKEQFKNRTIQKEYLALAHGRVSRDWDEINFPIGRGSRHDRMAARPEKNALDENERQAKTEFTVEKHFVNFTLLRVTLHTGRMHQIRVHLLAYNHPLVGDPLYNQKKRQSKWDALCGRLFLHSTKLGFTDLNGAKQIFENPLPKKLATFLKTLS